MKKIEALADSPRSGFTFEIDVKTLRIIDEYVHRYFHSRSEMIRVAVTEQIMADLQFLKEDLQKKRTSPLFQPPSEK